MTAKREISGYNSMWLIAMFDLPVVTKEARYRYTRFRNGLLKEGFTMLQFSVYARFCSSEETSDVFRKRIREILPKDGEVRLLAITDRQFGKMEIFFGKKRTEVEKPPEEFLLF
ncbi:MAG: CRISPR-associated endonuclease Cas2 [Thermodesulfovibrionales bacterium]|nr:CRISPR-associated endonuclease Cas2 [Thermodesulfovibrionales bacterium]